MVHFSGIYIHLLCLLQMLGGALGAQDSQKAGHEVLLKTTQKQGFLCGV